MHRSIRLWNRLTRESSRKTGLVSGMSLRKLIVGNWKMNGSLAFNQALLEGVLAGWPDLPETQGTVDVAVAPPAVYLEQVRGLLQGSEIALAAQDVSAAESGAYTGDVAAPMLKELGVRYVIVGHSERRKYQGEIDALVADKTAAALREGLTPIVCLGETLEERDAGQALQVVQRQLRVVVERNAAQAAELVVAYEPVWAIGTGRTATPEQAQEVHAALRQSLWTAVVEKARQIPILYGGSLNAANAAELLAQNDIDGGLIGGAALKAEDFLSIIASARSTGCAPVGP